MSSTHALHIGPKTLEIETGKLAQQADGSVVLRYGDNVLLVTATTSKPREGIDFFPLTIEVEERLYARGKIPGSFFRREGRPSTHATLIARLTDRPIRPLFPEGFRNEVQVIITPLSTDQEQPLDPLAIIGASAALSISDIPFLGPIAATTVGYVDGEFVLFPTYEQLESSDIDIVVAGSSGGVVMMEASANQMSEALVLEAMERAQEANLKTIELQEEVIAAAGKAKREFESRGRPAELDDRMAEAVGGRLRDALGAPGTKEERAERLDALRSEVIGSLSEEFEARPLRDGFEAILEEAFKEEVLSGGSRPDGRGAREIRPLSSEVALLPRTHGSGLFTRGETQILGIATLGSTGDAQKLDTLSPQESKRFLLHYNFPPYSVGEVRRVGSPGRREIGHGALAERALAPVLPEEADFPYTLRVVCEALSSNGSTSMASVCAATLALMDAGVPIKTPVAGISVGLVTGEDGRYVTLTDIQGLEDHVGDMDFKVAGSAKGITAIQLDIKVKSIGFDVVRDTLEQAREARLEILDHMSRTIAETRSEMSQYAPRMSQISIPVEKIGAVIGPGGKTIRGIVEQTGATVDVQDDGTVTIGSTDAEAANKAISMIEDLTREVKVGDIYTGKVVRLMGFGAFVQILPGRDGLVHISELANYHVPSVEDVVDIGEEVTVVVKEIDSMGRINLSRRALLEDSDGDGSEGGDPPGVDRPLRAGNGGPQSGDRRPDGPRPPRRGGDRGGFRPQGSRPGGHRGGRPGGNRPPPRRGPR